MASRIGTTASITRAHLLDQHGVDLAEQHQDDRRNDREEKGKALGQRAQRLGEVNHGPGGTLLHFNTDFIAFYLDP
jgi:hypothetical protein